RDIAAWQTQYDVYRDAKEQRRLEQLEQRYRADVEQKQSRETENARVREWANSFYDEYDHFDNPSIKPIVTQAYLDNQAEIDDLRLSGNNEGARERLAELADARLLEIKRAGKSVESPNDNRRRLPNLESSAAPTP